VAVAVAVDAVVTAAVVVVVVETASLAGKDRSKLTITTAPLEHRVDAPGALFCVSAQNAKYRTGSRSNRVLALNRANSCLLHPLSLPGW